MALRGARILVRWWWAVLVVWAVGLVLALTVAPTFSDVATFDDSAFLPEDSRAARGHDLLEQGWPEDNFTRSAVIAIVRPQEPLTAADEDVVRDLVDWLRGPQAPEPFTDVVTHLEDRQLEAALASDDGHAMLVIVGLDQPPFSPQVAAAVRAARTHIHDAQLPVGLDVYVTGSAGFAVDEDDAIEASLARTQVLTIVLVIGLLLWIFRSPVAALVPLLTVGAGYLMALAVVALLASAGMQVTYLFQTFAIVIVFGAGTDYSLLTMTRFDQELHLAEQAGYRSTPRLRAATLAATMAVLGGVLASSAASTFVGFSAQSVAEFGLFRTMGPALAIAVAVTLVSGLTLTPALMQLAGRWLYWPERYHLPRVATGSPLVARRRELAGELERDRGGPL